MIEETVERKLREVFGAPEPRPVEEVLAALEHHRWTPPPGAKSSYELLREDRDRG